MKRILLIVSGGIAAYKSLELIRLLKKSGHNVRVVLTEGGAKFVTPLSLAALSEDKVYTDLWSLTDEAEMGHIQLSRDADLVVVAPASADDERSGQHRFTGDGQAGTGRARDEYAHVGPRRHPGEYRHAARARHIVRGSDRGRYGVWRIRLWPHVRAHRNRRRDRRMSETITALVTSGPTHEPIDPVRYIGNRSSGKQGHAIAIALAAVGMDVTLVTGPTALPDPPHVKTIRVTTGIEMFEACKAALPVDIAVYAAAVADWRVETPATTKLKKTGGPPQLRFVENPDILGYVAKSSPRPRLVIGFAAETENLIAQARAKRERKGCDWILANLVDETGAVFGSDANRVTLVTAGHEKEWKENTKKAIAERLAKEICTLLEKNTDHER